MPWCRLKACVEVSMDRLCYKFAALIVIALIISAPLASPAGQPQQVHPPALSPAGVPGANGGAAMSSASSAVIVSLWPVPDAVMGNPAILWAEVRNTGTEALPAGCTVRFWVSGLINPWVGATSIAGLAPGATAWYSFRWTVSIEIKPGNFTYWAIAYDSSGPISDWSIGQDFAVTGVPNVNGLVGHIASLYPVSNASPGSQAILWFQVQNIGQVTFPGLTYVEVYVGGLSDPIVGRTYVGGIEPGSIAWYSFAWDIPRTVQPGAYTYWARVARISIPLSDWSPGQDFNIHASPAVGAQVIDVDPVAGATVGGKAALAAQIRNIGTSVLPSDALVWFYVEGAGLSDPWVGSVSAAGLAVDDTAWFNFTWNIPSTVQQGTFSYKARVYVAGSTAISDFGPSRSFAMSGSTQSGFNETFDSGTADNWTPDFGTWLVRNGFYNAQGIANSVVTSTYNVQYANLDFSAQMYRAGLEFDQPAFLEIRASGGPTGVNNTLLNGYRFQYNTIGQFSIYKCVNGSLTPLQDWKPSTAIIQGQSWNILRVTANFNVLSFYINGTMVWTGQDNSLASGRVGLGTASKIGTEGEILYVDWAKLTTDVAQ